ncbi:uncharacterized protein LOC115978122 isoform X2 [Quercus lobata]|uniref:uncharacterized protein LOC115978122 isoform X2 n=1 Tax=Quercus lobata TaxID=97700 RepID=UPI001246EA83|nr:uncharacterized protein LOC115978122 isoform X2 [Quercus lobata]
MAKRELSSTLRNLKFMQRAALREENTKKDEDVKPDGVVIMEGDPNPGAIKGRMSFQSFNPSIDHQAQCLPLLLAVKVEEYL